MQRLRGERGLWLGLRLLLQLSLWLGLSLNLWLYLNLWLSLNLRLSLRLSLWLRLNLLLLRLDLEWLGHLLSLLRQLLRLRRECLLRWLLLLLLLWCRLRANLRLRLTGVRSWLRSIRLNIVHLLLLLLLSIRDRINVALRWLLLLLLLLWGTLVRSLSLREPRCTGRRVGRWSISLLLLVVARLIPAVGLRTRTTRIGTGLERGILSSVRRAGLFAVDYIK